MNFVAAAGGAGLVIIGVAAALYFAQRRRDYEFAALRAMGTASGQILRTLALEQVLLLGFAVVGGPRPRLPHAAADDALLRTEPRRVLSAAGARDRLGVAGIALAAIVAATALGLALSARALLRSSVTGVLRGEAE